MDCFASGLFFFPLCVLNFFFFFTKICLILKIGPHAIGFPFNHTSYSSEGKDINTVFFSKSHMVKHLGYTKAL